MANIANPFADEFREQRKRYNQALWLDEDGRFDPASAPMSHEDREEAIMNYIMKELRRKYAYAVLTNEEIETIVSYAPKIVSLGAGTGYVEWLLSQAGAEVVAFDKEPYKNAYCDGDTYFPVSPIHMLDMNEFTNHSLLLCWPPYDTDMASIALSGYKGNMLVYIGEGVGMATGDDEFHQMLEDDWSLIFHKDQDLNYMGIYSQIFVYRRKETANDQTPGR
jgi:hypothetical protein